MKPKNFIVQYKDIKTPRKKRVVIKKLPPRYADGLKPSITAKASQYANSWRLK